jgi:hypothetical protein
VLGDVEVEFIDIDFPELLGGMRGELFEELVALGSEGGTFYSSPVVVF